MQIGYNTNGFASHSLDAALEVIAGLGYRAVAITLDHHALDPFDPATPARARQVALRLRALGLAPVIETGARFLLDPWRKHAPTLLDEASEARARRRDFLTRAIDVAAALDARVVSLWSGKAPDGTPGAVLDERLAEGLAALCRHAAARGVVIGFEPEPGMWVETLDHFQRVARLVRDPTLRLTLDAGHAHLLEPGGAEAALRAHGAGIVNVHLEGMRRPLHDHLPPWEGDLDVLGFVRALDATGYTGPVTFELSRHSHDAVQIARRALEFVQPALQGGRS